MERNELLNEGGKIRNKHDNDNDVGSNDEEEEDYEESDSSDSDIDDRSIVQGRENKQIDLNKKLKSDSFDIVPQSNQGTFFIIDLKLRIIRSFICFL